MKAQALLACVAASVTVFSFFGCSSPEPPPKFDPGDVQTKAEQAAYPAGPFGIGIGSTIPNLSFVGYANAVANADSMQLIELGHFYNPHGRDASYAPASQAEDDRLFPAGSQYGEFAKKPTVLAISVSSVWCNPCNLESKCLLPVHQREYGACGGGLFLQLQDGPTYGKAATPQNLKTWAQKTYKEDFPTAIDPAGRLISSVATQEAFPVNIIIDTTTMKIVESVAGIPDSTYWHKYEKLLADPSCPSQHVECDTTADCADHPGTVCSTTCPANAILCIPHSCQPSLCKSN
ncbi:MAG: hypothetical protein QM820_16275 [Minicystis sp.]